MCEFRRWCIALLSALALQAQAAPQRIVSMLPSLTETVCVLGHCDALVAVDDYSDWPEQVNRLPRVGGLEDTHIESIVALRPDLVIASASTRAVARLRSLGVPVLTLEPKTLEDVHTSLQRIGEVLGESAMVPRVWSRLNEGIAQAAQAVPPSRKGVRVYFEVDSGPYAAGEISHIGELLKRLGAANIVPASMGSVPRLNPEFVVRADPQVIIVAASGAAEMRSRPGWSRISAIREGRVCVLDRAQGSVIGRPGPRLAEAARVLAQCLAR